MHSAVIRGAPRGPKSQSLGNGVEVFELEAVVPGVVRGVGCALQAIVHAVENVDGALSVAGRGEEGSW